MMPISAIESASSCRAIGSNSRRGWFGFTEILLSSTSLMEEEPEVLTSSFVEISASSPLPSANFFLYGHICLFFQLSMLLNFCL